MTSFRRLLAVAAVGCAVLPGSAQVTPTAPVAPGAQPVVPAAPAAPPVRTLPPSRWSSLQIQQSFEFADGNSNGELTRAEAQQLTILPRGFEDMDQNKDGVVTRAEYESAFGR